MVYFKPGGRLGNLLFEYAAAISLGRGRAVAVADPSFRQTVDRYGMFFRDLEIVQAPPDGALVLKQDGCNFLEIPDVAGRDVVLEGFFQSERYLDSGIVRRAYAMPEETAARLRRDYGDWLSRPNVASIHVRRGDYLLQPQFHPFAGERYFRDCLARLRESEDFIVCSDDLPWCRAFFPKAFPDRRFRFSETGSPVDDIYLCSLCRHNVMSNSSFSWWGAWLNENPGKRMLAPSQWFGYACGHDWSSIYAEGMEIVRNRYTFAQRIAAWMADRRQRREFREAARKARQG